MHHMLLDGMKPTRSWWYLWILGNPSMTEGGTLLCSASSAGYWQQAEWPSQWNLAHIRLSHRVYHSWLKRLTAFIILDYCKGMADQSHLLDTGRNGSVGSQEASDKNCLLQGANTLFTKMCARHLDSGACILLSVLTNAAREAMKWQNLVLGSL